jgi:NAD(P)-dependent dehydrogenase (short-subunit alcohol dehydrogenase family)
VRAIVTGAARGLGEAVAGRLAGDGASVLLADVSPGVTETAARIAAMPPGRRAAAIVADVADEAACELVVGAALTRFGGVDVLVNCAGIGGGDTPVTGTSLGEFRDVLGVNLTGTFLMCRAAARAMINGGSGGAIVNTGSLFGQQAVAGGAAYCASKAGVAVLTQSLALELAPHGIRANTIAPGHMATEMHWEALRAQAAAAGTSFGEQVEATRRSVPLGRHGTGADVAGTVAWLISDDAAYDTGQTIGVNGGVLLS